MKKYYAVRKGRQTGIFYDWTTCEKQIKGYSGAEYKSFKTMEEAEKFMSSTKEATAASDVVAVRQYPCAYIDGSYDSVTQRFSFGAVIMPDSNTELHFSEAFAHSELAKMRNVAGEIKGSEFAIQYALEQGWSKIDIYYDYFGIEKWALGEWKRNLSETQAYHEFCQSALKQLDIRFNKVKGHSGDSYNDLADSLAKKALNL